MMPGTVAKPFPVPRDDAAGTPGCRRSCDRPRRGWLRFGSICFYIQMLSLTSDPLLLKTPSSPRVAEGMHTPSRLWRSLAGAYRVIAQCCIFLCLKNFKRRRRGPVSLLRFIFGPIIFSPGLRLHRSLRNPGYRNSPSQLGSAWLHWWFCSHTMGSRSLSV